MQLILYILNRMTFTAYIVIAMTFILFIFIGVLCFHEVPKESQSVVFTLLGGIGGSVGTIVTFKFGSSSGSERKDNFILKQ